MPAGIIEAAPFDRAASSRDSGLPPLALGRPLRLTCETLELAALHPRLDARFTPPARDLIALSNDALRRAHARGDAIYGLTTGFGPLVKFHADECVTTQGAGLIAHLGAGFGEPAPPPIVRAAMILRAHAIGQGCSGIDPAAADAFLQLLRVGIVPEVPAIGSVGASGDLVPLSFIARVLTGEGRAFTPDHIDNDHRCSAPPIPAGDALARAGLTPLHLSGRDALALVNGTSFMAAYAALAIARAQRLIERAESLTGWIYRQLGCREQALDPRLHAARGHDTQARSARAILDEARADGPFDDPSRPLQEVYSLRCAPQILGACRDNLDHARRLVEREINGVNDNPLVCTGSRDEDLAVLHGGNFQGQQVAFAADALNAALVQTAILAERQLDVLCNPEFTAATPLLAHRPGATSGFAGAQITATSIIAEMRLGGGPVATSSIPTNGRNQDIVSMGTTAARAAMAQTDRLAAVLAITAMGCAQLDGLRRSGRCPGRTTPAPAWMPGFDALTDDRPLFEDIARVARSLIAA